MISVRRLEPHDNRAPFRSGNIDLDRFFTRYAGQNQFRHHIGTTYVALDESESIIGFATVAASELAIELLSETKRRQLPAYPIPVLRLARLAVAEKMTGQGVAQALLQAIFAIARKMSAEMGCLGVVVDAKPEAITFYRKLGFVALQAEAGALGDRPEPLPMFLELRAIPKPSNA